MKFAILLHIGYLDLWKEMKNHLSNIKIPYDLWITISGDDEIDKRILKDRILHMYPESNVLLIHNRGMDMGGFFIALKQIFNKGIEYDFILKLHTKRNDIWRNDLLSCLLNKVEEILEIFKDDHDVGVIGSKKYMTIQEDQNRQAFHISRLSHKFSITIDQLNWTFIAGSMSWFRDLRD